MIKEIFHGIELTLDDREGYVLNKWGKGESFNIPMRVGNYLINSEVLILDSGNFETGEQHFIYNKDKHLFDIPDEMMTELIPILRDIRINKILK